MIRVKLRRCCLTRLLQTSCLSPFKFRLLLIVAGHIVFEQRACESLSSPFIEIGLQRLKLTPFLGYTAPLAWVARCGILSLCCAQVRGRDHTAHCSIGQGLLRR